MSKFKKQKKEVPAISTASLPDVVFMLLFFFMTVTTMRETDLKIADPEVPSAKTVKKIEDKNFVRTVFVGKSRDENQIGDFIQLNDKIAQPNDIKDFVLKSTAGKSADEVAMMSTVFKSDKNVGLGTIADIKKELRNVDALKIAYVAAKSKE